MPRVRTTVSVAVDRPAEQVFAYLADVTRHPEWSPKPLRVEGAAAGPAAVGSRFTSVGSVPGDPEHRNDVEVTACDAPARLELVADDPAGRFVNEFAVVPTGSGCRVERTMDLPRPGGVVGLLFPLLVRGFVRPDMTKGLRMLRANVERTAPTP